MRATILMASIAVLLSGGGAAFAQSRQVALAPGLATTVSEPTNTDWSGKVFDQTHQGETEAHEKLMSDETARIQRQLQETRRRYPPGFLQESPEIAR